MNRPRASSSAAAPATVTPHNVSPLARQGLVRMMQDPDRDPPQRPLDLRMILRLLGYMRPYRARRNWLFLCVVLRGIQLPAFAWAIGAVIKGPIAHGGNVMLGALGVLLLGIVTQITFHFRYRLALELGEAVIHDLR